jgi:predicted nucleic acid-binding protein
MTLYFDTACLFRLYSTEPGWEEVRALADGSTGVASAWHARAEFASVLLRKRREGHPGQAVLVVRRQFRHDLRRGVVRLLPPEEPVMSRLERVLEESPPETFLRAGDALHLASAAVYGFAEVYSSDRQFLAAASLFGLRGIDPTGRR